MSWLTPFFCGKIHILATLTENNMTVQDFTFAAAHLGCSRDETLLFKPVNFNLRNGEGIVVEGINGIGKTTLLRVLAGLLPPLCGKINSTIPIRESLAYLGPHNAVKGLLTPLEYLTMTAIPLSDIMNQLQLKTLAHKPCATLSSGQKQRVALARIVSSQKPLWILDEPMTALDKSGEAIFAELLKTHLAQGGIAIIATHQALPLPLKKLVLEI